MPPGRKSRQKVPHGSTLCSNNNIALAFQAIIVKRLSEDTKI